MESRGAERCASVNTVPEQFFTNPAWAGLVKNCSGTVLTEALAQVFRQQRAGLGLRPEHSLAHPCHARVAEVAQRPRDEAPDLRRQTPPAAEPAEDVQHRVRAQQRAAV